MNVPRLFLLKDLFLMKAMSHTDGRREENKPALLSHSAKASSPLSLGQEGQVPDLYPSSTGSPQLLLTPKPKVSLWKTDTTRYSWEQQSPGHPLWLHLKVALQEMEDTGRRARNALCMPYGSSTVPAVCFLTASTHSSRSRPTLLLSLIYHKKEQTMVSLTLENTDR